MLNFLGESIRHSSIILWINDNHWDKLYYLLKEGYTKLFINPKPSTTTHNYPQTLHNHSHPLTTTWNYPQPPATTHNHPQPPTNTLQPPKTTHHYPQLSTTIHNHPQPSKNTHNHSQPSTITEKPPTITQKHPQPSNITQKVKTYHKQLCYCTLDVNIETDVDFDSDMKHW